MAIIQSALLSKGIGSAGTVTFRRLNGKTIASEKAIRVSNPQTPAQAAVRIRMAVGSKLIATFDRYLKERGFESERRSGAVSKNGSQLTSRQALVHEANQKLLATPAAMVIINSNSAIQPIGLAVAKTYADEDLRAAIRTLPIMQLPKANALISVDDIKVVQVDNQNYRFSFRVDKIGVADTVVVHTRLRVWVVELERMNDEEYNSYWSTLDTPYQIGASEVREVILPRSIDSPQSNFAGVFIELLPPIEIPSTGVANTTIVGTERVVFQ